MSKLLIQGNSIHIPVADKSVQCEILSPPYWGQRAYETGDNKNWELGTEPLHDCEGKDCGDCYVCHMRMVGKELFRVLRDDGTMFLNIGDCYSGSGKGPTGHNGIGNQSKRQGFDNHKASSPPGLKPKDLCGIPWRVALALQKDGWYLRNEIIWYKRNVMPSSAQDRFTNQHEQIFLFSKSEKYFFDIEAIKEKSTWAEKDKRFITGATSGGKQLTGKYAINKSGAYSPDGMRQPRNVFIDNDEMFSSFLEYMANSGIDVNGLLSEFSESQETPDLWDITTRNYGGEHFATFPPMLAEKAILAGTSQKGCCPICHTPWKRIIEKVCKCKNTPVSGVIRKGIELTPEDGGLVLWLEKTGGDYRISTKGDKHHNNWTEQTTPNGRQTHFEKKGYSIWSMPSQSTKTLDWEKNCECESLSPVPCIVLDPFSGSGTTVMKAIELGRHGIGIDLSGFYTNKLAKKRTKEVQIRML
jgi:DNA modification methylase